MFGIIFIRISIKEDVLINFKYEKLLDSKGYDEFCVLCIFLYFLVWVIVYLCLYVCVLRRLCVLCLFVLCVFVLLKCILVCLLELCVFLVFLMGLSVVCVRFFVYPYSVFMYFSGVLCGNLCMSVCMYVFWCVCLSFLCTFVNDLYFFVLG